MYSYQERLVYLTITVKSHMRKRTSDSERPCFIIFKNPSQNKILYKENAISSEKQNSLLGG